MQEFPNQLYVRIKGEGSFFEDQVVVNHSVN